MLDSLDINKKYLLAVSGGVDSMVLLNLFHLKMANFAVAHCNFHLRDEDSNLDQKLVEETCQSLNIPLFIKEFDVAAYQNSGNYSLEMAARNLRYEWFEELINQNDFNCLVTAHHADDQIETFLINLARGSGLKGLTGMKILQNKIYRPLLNYSKNQILDFANRNQLIWREDKSNETDDYVRNRIRHHITPELKKIPPNFEKNFQKSLSLLNDELALIQAYFKLLIPKISQEENDEIHFDVEELKKLDPLETHIFHLFKPYGFVYPQEIIKLLSTDSGKETTTNTHRLLINRGQLILKKNELLRESEEYIISEQNFQLKQLNLEFIFGEKFVEKDQLVLSVDDAVWPLKMRKPKNGDFFYPAGMNGKKKLSKYFKDLKLSKFQKEEIWLLTDNNDQILWVKDYRLDQRFVIKKTTHNFLSIHHVE